MKGKRGLALSNCLHDPQLALEEPAKKDKSCRNHIYRTKEIISGDRYNVTKIIVTST